MTTRAVLDAAGTGRLARFGAFLLRELGELAPPTLFFFVGFNLILFTKRLFLADYLIQYAGFLIATTGALIVGKVVLIAGRMPFLHRFDHAPLACPILFKSLVYTAFVSLARMLELLIRYLSHQGILGGGRFVRHLLGAFSWPHFIATQLWVAVLFLIYVTVSEFNALFGDGELFRVFFAWRKSELKSTRRARIRLLTRLARLTDSHSIAVLEDSGSLPHAELVAILRTLSAGSEMRNGQRVSDPAPVTAAE